MLRLTLMMLALVSAAGCASGPAPADRGLCDGLTPLEDAHAAALVADGGDRSVVTGERLLSGIDAGCGRAR